MTGLFFHVACMGNSWQQITAGIMESILQSQLYDKCDELHIGVIGSPANFAALQEAYPTLEKVRWHYHGSNFGEYEFPTIMALADFCRENPGAKVLYCHTKGVSKRDNNPYWKYWRRYMVESCINQHEKHIDSLDDNDTSGNMWTDDRHFSGNFWWANASHINQLPDIAALKQNPVVIWPGHTYAENFRLQCEMWIGMKKGIRVKEHGILNMKPGFFMRIPGQTDSWECPLNKMNFDRIYLVNLDDRADRYSGAMKQIEKIGLDNVTRFPAINARKLGITKKTLDNPGLIGCFMSHFFILQEAVMHNFERILVFEDDVTFAHGFNEILSYSLEQLPDDWELVYLGYTEREGLFTYKKMISENIAVPKDPWGTQAYMVQKNGIRILYENLKEIKDHVDLQMSRQICPLLKAYEIFPALCPQSDSRSDINVADAPVNIKINIRGRGHRKLALMQ